MLTEILGRKIGMTQVFDETGAVVPVTVIEAGPCTVIGVRSTARDGYEAIRLGFDPVENEKKAAKHMSKPVLGQFKEVAPHRHIREVRLETPPAEELAVGTLVKAGIFAAGDQVDISGFSKGKGFQGVVKRHGFHGGPDSHGSNFHRRPGSIGQSADPSRVIKGTRLPGRMGNEKVTVQNLRVVRVDEEKNVILIRGAVPGRKGTLLAIRKSVKAKPAAAEGR